MENNSSKSVDYRRGGKQGRLQVTAGYCKGPAKQYIK